MKVSIPAVFTAAFRYSIPVLLGYTAIGMGFGLLLSNAGYPWYLSLVMSIAMYAGAGQYIALGLFAAGTSLWEVCLVQLVVNARHLAYGFSMISRYNGAGPLKFYLMFSLTDETFALLSSLDEKTADSVGGIGGVGDRHLFMFYVSALNQFYWTAGSVIGTAAGTLIPFSMEGIGFALTALFIVFMIEQILQVKKPTVFVVSAAVAVLTTLFLPGRVSLLSAMALSLALASVFAKPRQPKQPRGQA